MCSKRTQTIKIRYANSDLPRLEKITKGDLIDLYTDSITFLNGRLEGNTYQGLFHLSKGDIIKVSFGVSMELPIGYEALVFPRSSTFKRTGMLLSNSVGVIDNEYNADDDVWCGIFYCTKDTEIDFGDRLVQFRIQENQPNINFEEVKSLNNEARGGFGSTGV